MATTIVWTKAYEIRSDHLRYAAIMLDRLSAERRAAEENRKAGDSRFFVHEIEIDWRGGRRERGESK